VEADLVIDTVCNAGAANRKAVAPVAAVPEAKLSFAKAAAEATVAKARAARRAAFAAPSKA